MSSLVVGVAGGSGSGKTTFARALAAELGDDVTVIPHDNYYKAHDELTYDERTRLNYDHPDAYDTNLMARDLAELKRGQTVRMPTYDFSAHNRSPKTIEVRPTRVIIVEGIMIFHAAELRDLMDIKVFVDTDADVRILRRAARDMQERGRSYQSVVDQYLNTVKPMHEQFVEPSKRHADVIVPRGGENRLAVSMLASRIREWLRGE